MPRSFTSSVNVLVADLKSSNAFWIVSFVRFPPFSEVAVDVSESFHVETAEQKSFAHSVAVSGLLLFPHPAASNVSAASSGSRASRLVGIQAVIGPSLPPRAPKGQAIDNRVVDREDSAAMCCLALSMFFIGPRFAFVLVWIFGDRVQAAFSTWVWPLLGLLFVPWTTLAYVLVWGPVHGVSGAGWLLVGFGVLLDVMTYSGRFARDRYQASRAV